MPETYHQFPYSIEFEYEYFRNSNYETPLLRSIVKDQCGFERIRDVCDMDKDDQPPIAVSRQNPISNGVYVATAYNDGSVDSELVFVSNKTKNLSNLVDKLNQEVKFSEDVGQHISIVYNDDENWLNKRYFFAVQNIALTIEQALLYHANTDRRPSSYWEWRSEAPEERSQKYSAVFLKQICMGDGESFHMAEFRLHHPIESATIYFDMFPKMFQEMSSVDLMKIGMYKNPIRSHKNFRKIVAILQDTFPNLGEDYNLKWSI